MCSETKREDSCCQSLDSYGTQQQQKKYQNQLKSRRLLKLLWESVDATQSKSIAGYSVLAGVYWWFLLEWCKIYCTEDSKFGT